MTNQHTDTPLVLSAENISKSYDKRLILRGVSVHVKQGEIVGLLGPNGAGKTSCFYIMCGLIAPDHGQILLGQQNITPLVMYQRARLGIGYLPQEASIFRGLTVEDNIRLVLEATSLTSLQREKKLEELLAEFSITHLRRSSALSLSGGERRRVEIARALATNPKFILFDEPLAGIDPIAVHDIRQLIMHLKKRGIGILVTDHNVRETLELVDRAYILHDGVILTEGTPKVIIKHPDAKRVYLGNTFNLDEK